MLPFFCEEKSNHACFWSFTKKDGVFSLLNGESPFHSRPAFLSDTRRPTTSETGRRARRSSRNEAGKRMVIRGLGCRTLTNIASRLWKRQRGRIVAAIHRLGAAEYYPPLSAFFTAALALLKSSLPA